METGLKSVSIIIRFSVSSVIENGELRWVGHVMWKLKSKCDAICVKHCVSMELESTRNYISGV